MSNYPSLKKYYNVVYDQCFSTNGKYLLTCDSFGQLASFNLAQALSSASESTGKSPTRLLEANDGPLYAMERVEKLLVCAGEGEISGWKVHDITKTSKQDTKPALTLTPPTARFGTPETNSLGYDEQAKVLYAGCGDSNVYAWDLNTGQLKGTYSGHSDYVHCVCVRSASSTQFISGAEDGTVKIWDPSCSKAAVHTLSPAGKAGNGHPWIGCVALDSSGDWLVCGGSIAPSIYHLSTLSKVASLEVPKDVVTQTAIVTSDKIITGGSEPYVRHWSINGEALACVPSGLRHAFSLALNDKNQVLTVCGDTADVPVFTNMGYKAFSLTVTSS